ncbi:hypothetical protein FDA48_06005 [Clostridium botulinum]|nr:hypothetical protein [Clostridium botulinum]
MFNLFRKKKTVAQCEPLIIGSPGSGKVRCYLKPNSMEMLGDSDIQINTIQYDLMLRTIGFEREKLKDNTFKMWRNILQQDKNTVDIDLKELMSLGLGLLEEGKRTMNFLVSKKGIDFISMIEKCSIDYNHFFDEGWDDD